MARKTESKKKSTEVSSEPKKIRKQVSTTTEDDVVTAQEKKPSRVARTQPAKVKPETVVADPVADDQPKDVKKGLFGRQIKKAPPVSQEVPQTPAPKRPVRSEPAPQISAVVEASETSAKVAITLRPKKSESKPEPQPTARKPKTGLKQEAKTTDAPFKAKSDLKLDDSLGRMVILKWREAGARQVEPESTEPQEQESRERTRPERKGRRDKQKTNFTEAVDDPQPKKEVKTDEVKDETPAVFEPITVPDTAAQIIMRDGVPVLVKDHKTYAPVVLYGNASTPAQESCLAEEIQLASENGVHLHSTQINLRVDESEIDDAIVRAKESIQRFSKIDSASQVILKLQFVAPLGWSALFPNADYQCADGTRAAPSICDDEYWNRASEVLSQFIAKLAALPEAANIMGVHLDRTAWHFTATEGYDTSEAARNQFRKWLRHRYSNDVVTLRASWYDGSVDFETAPIPGRERRANRGDKSVQMDRRARRWTDYHLFLSDITVGRLIELCYAVKMASNAMFLTGVSYGFTFEWSHPSSGHLSLGKLLRCPFLDYVSGPPSYKDREPGGTAAFPLPIDSISINGKLYLSEEDFRTPIGGHSDSESNNPIIKTPQALESAHWRGAGSALAHRHGVMWMDTNGHGWLSSRGIWERGSQVHDALIRRLVAPNAAPDVAMLVDERSLSLLVDEHAFSALVQNVQESLLRSGLSVGFYLLSDLAHRENFPDCKLYIFANAWDIRPEVRSAIKTRLHRDGKVLFWLYTAGLFEGGRESMERIREVTGIALRPQPFNSKPGTTILNVRDPLCQPIPLDKIREGGKLEPSYFAIPEEANVLAEYTQTALASYVVHHLDEGENKWTSVFLGEPVVTPGLFRALGVLAGCHVWCHDDDVVHSVGNFLTIHSAKAGMRTLNLPDKWVAYRIESKEYLQVELNQHKFLALDGATNSFIVGTKDVVTAIVEANPSDFEKMEVSSVREENVMHWDREQFDVPIMKLDEWVEETWSDELADDLLVKPSLMEVDLENAPDESEDEPRSRGRRRKRRRNGKPDRDDANKQPVGDTGFSVMFRKRE